MDDVNMLMTEAPTADNAHSRSPDTTNSEHDRRSRRQANSDPAGLQAYLSKSPGEEHIRFHRMLADAQATRDFDLIRRLLAIIEPLLPNHPVLRQWYTHTLGYLALEADNQIERAASYQESLLAEHESLDPELRGRVLIELGAIYERLDRWDKALHCYQNCLELYEAQGNYAALAVTLCNMAILYYKTQNYPAAIECAQHSIELLEKSPDSPSKQQALCAVWSQLGETYLRQGNLAEAERALHNSISICERSNRHFCQGVPYDNLGHVYRQMGRYAEAEACYQLAREISKELANRRDEAEAAFGLGMLKKQSGASTEALAYFDEALAAAEAGNDYELAVQVHMNRAELYEHLGHLDAALGETERVVEIVESLRANILLPEDRVRMTAARVEAYEQCVRRLLRIQQQTMHHHDASRVARAFRYAEMSKSRALIEMLAGRPVRPPAKVPQSWLDEQARLRQSLHELYRDPHANTAQIGKLEARLNQLRERIRLRDAEFRSFDTVDPLTLEDVQSRLADDAALLEYFAAGDELLAFVVTSDAAELVSLPLKMSELRRAFVQVDGRFGPVHGVALGAHQRLNPPWLLNKLHQRLIEPIAPMIASAQTLCIVPHGLLHHIPFHALYQRDDSSGAMHFLADVGEQPRNIIYAPSATVLFAYCQDKPTSRQRGCLALGYDNAVLIHAEMEARRVADIVGGKCKVGAAATRETLLRGGARYRYIHIACHGWFNATWPMASALAMADGELDVSDVLQQMRLDAELVSLSACETGRSEVLKGDELIGLTRAFLYAGTPSVAVSQWLMDDLSSRILMVHFYQTLMHSTDRLKSRALAKAQRYIRELSLDELREMMLADGYERIRVDWQLKALAYAAGYENIRHLRGDERVFNHPYYWASLFLVGDRL